MNYSFTGLAYLIIFLTLGYFAYRLFQYWQKERNLISKLWLYFVVLFDMYLLIRAIGGMFFANNQFFLERTIYVSSFIQALALAIMAYLIIALKFPKVSPWVGFIFVLVLGLIAAFLTIFIPFFPFLTSEGSINWGMPSGPLVLIVAVIRSFLFIITFIPLIIINLQQFRISEDSYVKRKALGLSLTILFLAIVALIDFLFVSVFKLAPIWRDWGYIFAGLILFITLLLAQRPLSSQKI